MKKLLLICMSFGLLVGYDLKANDPSPSEINAALTSVVVRAMKALSLKPPHIANVHESPHVNIISLADHRFFMRAEPPHIANVQETQGASQSSDETSSMQEPHGVRDPFLDQIESLELNVHVLERLLSVIHERNISVYPDRYEGTVRWGRDTVNSARGWLASAHRSPLSEYDLHVESIQCRLLVQNSKEVNDAINALLNDLSDYTSHRIKLKFTSLKNYDGLCDYFRSQAPDVSILGNGNQLALIGPRESVERMATFILRWLDIELPSITAPRPLRIPQPLPLYNGFRPQYFESFGRGDFVLPQATEQRAIHFAPIIGLNRPTDFIEWQSGPGDSCWES